MVDELPCLNGENVAVPLLPSERVAVASNGMRKSPFGKRLVMYSPVVPSEHENEPEIRRLMFAEYLPEHTKSLAWRQKFPRVLPMVSQLFPLTVVPSESSPVMSL